VHNLPFSMQISQTAGEYPGRRHQAQTALFVFGIQAAIAVRRPAHRIPELAPGGGHMLTIRPAEGIVPVQLDKFRQK
jgi:hypothetical protein